MGLRLVRADQSRE